MIIILSISSFVIFSVLVSKYMINHRDIKIEIKQVDENFDK